MLWFSSSPSRIRKLGDIHGTLSLNSDGLQLACQRWPGKVTPFLKTLDLLHGAYSSWDGNFKVHRSNILYQWAAECVHRGNRNSVAHLTESPSVFCAKHLLCCAIFMDDKPNVKILHTLTIINLPKVLAELCWPVNFCILLSKLARANFSI